MLLTCKLPQWLNAANVFNNKFFDRSIDYRFRDMRMNTQKSSGNWEFSWKWMWIKCCTLVVQNLLVWCCAAYWFGLILYSCGKGCENRYDCNDLLNMFSCFSGKFTICWKFHRWNDIFFVEINGIEKAVHRKVRCNCFCWRLIGVYPKKFRVSKFYFLSYSHGFVLVIISNGK